MLFSRHKEAINNIKKLFEEAGYILSQELLNAKDFGVPQDRKRVFFIGIRKDLGFNFIFPKIKPLKKSLQDSVFDLKDSALPAG